MGETGIEILVVINKINRCIIILVMPNNKKMLKSIFFGILNIVYIYNKLLKKYA